MASRRCQPPPGYACRLLCYTCPPPFVELWKDKGKLTHRRPVPIRDLGEIPNKIRAILNECPLRGRHARDKLPVRGPGSFDFWPLAPWLLSAKQSRLWPRVCDSPGGAIATMCRRPRSVGTENPPYRFDSWRSARLNTLPRAGSLTDRARIRFGMVQS